MTRRQISTLKNWFSRRDRSGPLSISTILITPSLTLGCISVRRVVTNVESELTICETEGANGHLPNLDLVNSASHILRHTGIPCLVAPAIDPPSTIDDLRPSRFAPDSMLTLLDARVVKEYERNTANLWLQMWNGASGRAGGPEGAFGRYRIDAMTLFGVPADGPHGFHSFGRCVALWATLTASTDEIDAAQRNRYFALSIIYSNASTPPPFSTL